MSDPIADIILAIIHGAVGSGGYKDADYIDDLTKQIRQKIGRELIEQEQVMTRHGINNAYDIPYVTSYTISKICQLEES